MGQRGQNQGRQKGRGHWEADPASGTGRALYLRDVRKYNRTWEEGAYPALEEFKPKPEDLSTDGV